MAGDYGHDIRWYLCNIVGYGDTTAYTTFAKATITLLSLGGLAIQSVMVFGVNKKLRLDTNQNAAFGLLNKIHLAKRKKYAAAALIDNWLWCCLLKKRGILWKNPRLIIKIKQLCNQFNLVRR